jgi:hypothetical protein
VLGVGGSGVSGGDGVGGAGGGGSDLHFLKVAPQTIIEMKKHRTNTVKMMAMTIFTLRQNIMELSFVARRSNLTASSSSI